MIFFFQLIHFLLIVIYKCDQTSNQYQCVGDYIMTPCDQNLDVGLNYFCSGTDIFKQYSSPTIYKFTFSGWFFLKGTINQNYNIITVLENNVLLFKVEYNMYLSLFTVTMISKSPQIMTKSDMLPLTHAWYFAAFKMEVLIGTQLNLKTSIYNYPSFYYLTQSTTTRNLSPFQASQMIFDYGNGQTQSQYSCLAIKSLFIYWDSDLTDYNQFSLFNDISATDIYLKWNYDTFYTQYNQGYVIQVNNPNSKFYMGINRNEQFVLKSQEQIITDFINANINQGFVLTFHFKLVPQFGSSNQIQIMKIFNYPNSQLIFINNQLQFFGQQIGGIQFNQWYQITIVCNQIAENFYWIINDNLATLNTFHMNSVLQFSQLQFGDSYNTKINLYLNHIRVYEGIFLTSSPSCFMLQGRSEKNCIICRSGYLIDYQNNMTCISPSSINQSTLIDNVKDWYLKQFPCPKNMILNSQSACVCLFQYYREGDDCLQCKNYCKGCIDANTCIFMDPNRQKNGKCLDNLFDDGYNCYSPKYNIQSRVNYIKTLSPNDINNSECALDGTQIPYLIDNSILQLQKGRGFQFSFSIIIHSVVSQATIAFLQDGGSDLFTIMQETTSQNGYTLPSISLYVQTSKVVNLIIRQGQYVWINFWTDFNSVGFYIYTNMIMQYKNIDVSGQFSSYVISNPKLCIGKCGSQLQNIYSCSIYSSILYIYDQKHIYDPTQVRYLMNLQTIQISFFILDFFNLPTSNSLNDQQNKYSLISNSNFITNRFKGIQFTQNTMAQISGVDFQQNYISFSCYIFIEALAFQQMLFMVDLGSSQLQYHIVPYGTKAFIRICQYNVCLDTKYSMLNINEIEVGQGSYYQDQNLSEKCFLFRNIGQMECLIPKKGYVFYQNNILITEDECNDLTLKMKSFHIINPSTQECIDTQLSQYCHELDDTANKLNCIKCLYQGQDPSQNCQCQFGMYLNLSTFKCQKCSPQCLTCQSLSDNCITCKYTNQNPPTCNCLLTNQYLDENSTCKTCSYKCDTCFQKSDGCTTCSINRSNPPACNCNFQHVEINGQCQQLECQNQCLSCDQSNSNCIECKIGRIDPPNCKCKPDYIDNQDGTCSQCILGYYYDQITNNCQQCSAVCHSCSIQKTNCTSCNKGLQFQNNKCICLDGTSMFIQNNEILCLNNMDTSLSVVLNSTFYYLVFKFDYDIQELNNYYKTNINQLISVNFSEVPINLYDISDPKVQGNLLKLKLKINKSFSTLHGWVQFLDNTQFMSTSQKYILSSQYKSSFIRFEIGPFLFDNSVMDGGLSDQIINKFKDSNTDIAFNFIKQFQIILYILNTAQPSALFLLLNATLPPNLYKFYQVIGLLVYPDVINYQSDNYKQDFQLFVMNLNQTEVFLSNEKTYQRLGFLNLLQSSSIEQTLYSYVCFDNYQYTPCYQNFNQSFSQLCTGNDIFSTYSKPSIQSFTATGWIFLMGDLNQNYNILTVLQGSTVLFKIEYNIAGQYFSAKLHSNIVQNFIYSNGAYTILNNGFNSFTAANLVYDLGNGQLQSQYSCLFIYQIIIFQGKNLNYVNQFSLLDDLSAYDIYLKQNYDTFYTQQNQGYLIQTNQPNGKLPIQINRNERFVLKTPQSGSSNSILIMYLTSQTNYQIYVSNNNLQLFDTTLQFILYDDLANIIVINLVSKLLPSQATFGDVQNTNYLLYLSYIRIYEGVFLFQTSTCLMLAAKKNQSCIICKSGYLLDYQNNMTCVSPSSNNQSTQISNVKDWFPKLFSFPKNMVLNIQNICECFFQFYRRGDNCYQCKNYFNGCLDLNTCIQMHPLRQSDGLCKTGYFDVGYNCIQPKFVIKSRINKQINLSPKNLGSGCVQEGTQSSYITQNSILQIQKGKGFFLGFLVTVYDLATSAAVAFINDSGTELFTIMFEINNNNG
ncbi:hypothetical protein ABPG73_020131 [Tetrahymena malaccensis]